MADVLSQHLSKLQRKEAREAMRRIARVGQEASIAFSNLLEATIIAAINQGAAIEKLSLKKTTTDGKIDAALYLGERHLASVVTTISRPE